MIVNEGGGGKRLPTLTDPATEYDIARGKQVIDANGEILTGQIQTFKSGYSSGLEATQVYSGSSGPPGGPMVDKIYMKYKVPDYPSYSMLYRPGSTIGIEANRSLFGNATPADVLIGKTFTSASGLNVQGTGAFSKVSTQTVSGNNSNQISVPYNGSDFPIAVFVRLVGGLPYQNGGVFMLDMTPELGSLCGNDYMSNPTVEFVSPTQMIGTRNVGVYFQGSSYPYLNILSPYQLLSGTQTIFESGRTYQVTILYN